MLIWNKWEVAEDFSDGFREVEPLVWVCDTESTKNAASEANFFHMPWLFYNFVSTSPFMHFIVKYLLLLFILDILSFNELSITSLTAIILG